MKILAVDDDQDIGALLAMIAAEAGYPDITVTMSGDSALEMLSDDDQQFDCFLLDINMPEMDGIELCRRIRLMETYRITPIIMLTAVHDKDSVARAFQVGATDYATKPFELLDLTARLNVAHKMSMLQSEVSAIKRSDTLLSSGSAVATHGLMDELEIGGFKNLIRLVALQNYVTQMSKAGSAASQVFAIKIDGIADIHARSSAAEFAYALNEAAEAITHCFMPFGHMLAYAGNGIFLVVSGKFTFEPAAWMESEIQARLDEKDMQYDSGAPLDIEVSIGNPMRPSAGEAWRANVIFDRAIARAERKSQVKLAFASIPEVSYLRKIS